MNPRPTQCRIHTNIDTACSRCMAWVRWNSPAGRLGVGRAAKEKHRAKQGIFPCAVHVHHQADCRDCRKWKHFFHWCEKQLAKKAADKSLRSGEAEDRRLTDLANKTRRTALFESHLNAEAEARADVRQGNVSARTIGNAGFVYVVENPMFPGWVKVGSAVDMAQRMASYQTGDPFRGYTVACRVAAKNRITSEREAHAAVESVAEERRGEWFKVARRTACEVVKKISRSDVFFVDTE